MVKGPFFTAIASQDAVAFEGCGAMLIKVKKQHLNPIDFDGVAHIDSVGGIRYFLMLTLFVLAGCGVSYNSPSVKSNRDETGVVTVVPLTAASIQDANMHRYKPRDLPSVFYSVTAPGSLRSTGSLPSAPYAQERRPIPPVLNAPPPIGNTLYRLGAGDVVSLSIKGNERSVVGASEILNAQHNGRRYTVRDDGNITIPDVGPISLVHMTLQEAEDAVFQALLKGGLEPSFRLEVLEFNSQKVTVGGAVGRAGVLPISLIPLTLGQALAQSGGAKLRDPQFAAIRIFRDGTLFEIPMTAFRDQAQLSKTVLQNGDAIFVDETYDLDRAFEFFKQQVNVITLRSQARGAALAALQSEFTLRRSALEERRSLFEARAALDAEDRDYVYLAGEVNSQARMPLPYGRHASLADVLFDNGGFDTTTGDPAEIYVLRANTAKSGEVTAYHLNAKNAVNLVLATQMQMRPNDIVFVEEQVITKWGRALQQVFPALVTTAVAN